MYNHTNIQGVSKLMLPTSGYCPSVKRNVNHHIAKGLFPYLLSVCVLTIKLIFLKGFTKFGKSLVEHSSLVDFFLEKKCCHKIFLFENGGLLDLKLKRLPFSNRNILSLETFFPKKKTMLPERRKKKV